MPTCVMSVTNDIEVRQSGDSPDHSALSGGCGPGRLCSAVVGQDVAVRNDSPTCRVHEVEVKYRVDDLDDLLAAVVRAGVVLGPTVEQDDQAYAPMSWLPGSSKIGVPFARLRTEGGRHVFTVKVPQDNELACVERETTVHDREGMHEALLLIGFEPTVKIRKVRRTAVWGDATFCVDVVAGLGVFVELERLLTASESGARVQAELDADIRGLGVSVQRVDQTYDSLLRAAVDGSAQVCG